VLIPEAELAARRAAWTPPKLVNKTPWEEIYRNSVGQLGTGACLEPATLYLNILETRGESRHNH
jgi:dihydroxy-acid dehydratase